MCKVLIQGYFVLKKGKDHLCQIEYIKIHFDDVCLF